MLMDQMGEVGVTYGGGDGGREGWRAGWKAERGCRRTREGGKAREGKGRGSR